MAGSGLAGALACDWGFCGGGVPAYAGVDDDCDWGL